MLTKDGAFVSTLELNLSSSTFASPSFTIALAGAEGSDALVSFGLVSVDFESSNLPFSKVLGFLSLGFPDGFPIMATLK